MAGPAETLSFAAQLPAIQIVAPLVAAPITILLPKGRAPQAWASLFAILSFAVSIALLHEVAAHGPISYALGGWAPPVGIEYRIDFANAIVLALVSGVAAIVFPFSYRSVVSEVDERQIPLFYAAALICMTGLLGVTITGDAFNVFVFLEISSLSTYALVALGAKRDRRALHAAFNYLVMGTIGATFFVIGVGLLYQATGSLNMADIAIRLEGLNNRVTEAAFAFIVVGIGLKLAMFPLHLWLPNAYTYAPAAVSACIAATSTKVAVYILIRFILTVFPAEMSFEQAATEFVLLPLGVAGMFLASLSAIFQSDVKRILAYSSIAQLGYMLVGVSLMTVDGVAAALVHVFNHALMKAALFMAVACVMLQVGGRSVDAFAGLSKRMPWTTGAFIISALSLVGVPLTVGFISKWQLLKASFGAGQPLVAFLIVASSLLAVIYMGRIIEQMVLRDPPSDGPLAGAVKEAPLEMLVPLWIMTGANIYFGLQTEMTAEIATRAAEALLGVGGAY